MKDDIRFGSVSELLEYEKEKELRVANQKAKNERLRIEKEQIRLRNAEKFEERIINIKNQESVKDIKGFLKNYLPTSLEERRANLYEAINLLVEKTKKKDIGAGDELQIAQSWKRKVEAKVDEFIDYLELTGRDGIIYGNGEEEIGPSDLQGLMNKNFKNKRTGGDNEDDTIKRSRDTYMKINLIENLIYDINIDYTSNLKTRKDLVDLEEYAEKIVVDGDGNKAKPFDESDVEKMTNYILLKNKGDFRKSPEAHLMHIFTTNFGLRRDTAAKLTINDIDVKNGVLHIPAWKNPKGNVDYTALPLNEDVTRMLGQIVERALEKNYNRLDEKGEVKIFKSSRSNQYKEYGRLMKNAGVDLEKYENNKFHGGRRYYGQAFYDKLRQGKYANDKQGSETELIMKAKRDVNETLGHNRKQLKNLDEYVPNCW